MLFFFRILRENRISLLHNGVTKSLCPKYGVTVSLSQSNVCLHNEHTKSLIGECKIALIVGSNIDGSPGIDDGLWGEVAERGKTVLDLCVMPGIRKPYERGGGHGTAGNSISQGF